MTQESRSERTIDKRQTLKDIVDQRLRKQGVDAVPEQVHEQWDSILSWAAVLENETEGLLTVERLKEDPKGLLNILLDRPWDVPWNAGE